MLTCIACSKQLGGGALHHPHDGGGDGDDAGGAATPSTRQAIKALTAQIKDMAMKASGAYRHCKPCTGSATTSGRRHHHHPYAGSDAGISGAERFCYSYRRAAAAMGSAGSTPGPAAGRVGGGGTLSSGEGTPASVSGRTEAASSSVFAVEEEEEPREWVAQVEPGVLITFLALPRGGNDLKRIRFSREMFNKWQAQRWWAENYDRVMELYNVQRFSRQAVPLPNPPRSEDESSKMESAEDSPVTPPLGEERLPHNYHRPTMGGGMGSSSSDSLEHHSINGHHHHQHHHAHHYYDSGGLTSTPKLSSISGAKTETSSMDASVRTSSSPEEEVGHSGELSVSMSNASDQETEWVEQDEPGVYITIRTLPGGIRELRRVRFSRERFGEMHARLWWEENRARVHQQYL